MSVVGLTGCPGVGKSVVAGLFEKLGAIIISGDEIGRNVVESSPDVLSNIVEVFGKGILRADGSLSRRALGKIVFSSKDNLDKLNRIVHPPLLIEMKKIIDQHRENDNSLMIVDAALIYEWGIMDWFDSIIVVYADYWLRIKRLKSLGLSDREAEDRTDSQIEQEEKIRRARYTIENNGLVNELRPVVEKLYRMIK